MVEVYLADRESGSRDEISRAHFLGSNGTLVGWSEAARRELTPSNYARGKHCD